MAKKKTYSEIISPKSLLILTLFERYGSMKAVRKLVPEITDKDVATCTREVDKAMKLYRSTEGAKLHKKKTSAKMGAYQLKITLEESNPPIWRRVVVPANITLDQLHRVFQIAMGWENYHLHEFKIGKVLYSDDVAEAAEVGVTAESDCDHRLGDLVTKLKTKFSYTYDFGDNWRHTVELEKIIPPGEAPGKAVCIDGEMCCPREDSGGLWRYYENLSIMTDPNHPEYADVVRWMGSKFNPVRFARQAANRRLAALKL